MNDQVSTHMRWTRGLLFQITLSTLVPLLAIALLASVSMVQHWRMQGFVTASAARSASIAATYLSNRLAERVDLLRALAQDMDSLPAGLPMQQKMTSGFANLRVQFDSGIVLLDPSGTVAAAAGDVQAWSSHPEVVSLQAQATTGQTDLVGTAFVQTADQRLILLAHPLLQSKTGQPNGVLVGAFSSASLGMDRLYADLKMEQNSAVYLLDRQGRLINDPQADREGQDADPLPGVQQVQRGEEGAFLYTDVQGLERLVAYAPVPANGWGVVVDESWQDIIQSMGAWEFSNISSALILLAVLVVLVMVGLVTTRIILPLRRLNQMAMQIEWGDLAAAGAPISGARDIQNLHHTLNDMTTRIQRYQAGMQSYTAAIIQGQEDERSRLARELHDDTTQALVGLIQRIKLAERDLTRHPDRVAPRLHELETLAVAAWQEVRQFCDRLRSPVLDQLGLVSALGSLTEKSGLPGHPTIVLDVVGTEQRFAPDRELAVFRIVQEGLNNVRQHAHAQNVTVTARFTDKELHVIIKDDGVGFVPTNLPYELIQQGHLGLAGMRERILLVGGSLRVESAPGQGTSIHVWVPNGLSD